MARPLRIEFHGALYHVTSPGDGREAIYLNDKDRQGFLAVLASVINRFHWQLHAYCLMDNHYHSCWNPPSPTCLTACGSKRSLDEAVRRAKARSLSG